MSMKVVAFLQNMWVRDPQRVHDGIARFGETFRRRMIYHSLFAGCLTGRRLKTAFGQDLIAEIDWEESTREIASDPRKIFPPDLVHIRQVLALHQPTIVLAFGRIAGDAVATIWTGPFIRAPHPAARQADVPLKLKAAAAALTLHLQGIQAPESVTPPSVKSNFP